MANTKITDLPTKQSVADSDYLIVDDGNTTYKAEKSKIANSTPFSFVGMVVQGTNLTTEASVKAIYGNTTSWSLLSSVALASEHIFGNGKALGLTNGNITGNLAFADINNVGLRTEMFGTIGQNVGGSPAGAGSNTKAYLGVPNKTQLGANPEYSGIIVDTIAVYMWERTA